MAVYQPPGRRRNLTLAVATVALVVGLTVGLIVGHATATGVDERIADARADARGLAGALQVLPLEYEQALGGTSETARIADTVDRATSRLPATLDAAPWLTAAQRGRVTAAVHAVRAAAAHRVPAARFRRTIDAAEAAIGREYGVTPNARR
jgi:hypothetical protein